MNDERIRAEIVDYFRVKSCVRCRENFRDDSVTIMSQSDTAVVAEITCSNCYLPLGEALIGMVKKHSRQMKG